MGRTRLGRGLDTLLATPAVEGAAPQTSEVSQVPTGSIHPNRYQPRTEFNQEALSELMESISVNGVLQPVIVRPDGTGYELIAGERRWRAASQLGMATVPAIVRDADDAQVLELALVENIQREDLNPIEKAKAYRELVERFALTQDQAAQRVGQKRSSVANLMRLLDLPADIQDSVSRGTLTMGHARALLALPDTDAQRRLAKRIERDGLSVRMIEKLIQEMNNPTERRRKEGFKPPHLMDLEDRLRKALGTRVTVLEGRGRGRIIIDFYSNDDFDRILEKLS